MPPQPFLTRAFTPLSRLLVFRSRTGPADFWPYMALLAVVYGINLFAVVLSPDLFGTRLPIMPLFVLTLVLVFLAYAAVVRRMHDVGWNGWWMTTYVLYVAVFVCFALYWRIAAIDAPGGSLMRVFFPLMFVAFGAQLLSLLILVVCLLPGTDGPNRFGEDPAQ